MEKVKLNELADIYLGVTHTPEYVFEGVPFLSVKDISGGKICLDDCKYISKEEYDSLSEGAKPKVGDMLFCRVGTLGKPIIIPEGTPLFGSFVSLGYLRNRNSDRCDLNYLRYWMYSNSFWKQVNANVKGASQVNLNTGWLSEFDIDLPGIAEQRYRISVLDKCKSVIEKREAELAALDDLIKARFVEMFANWKKKYLAEPLGEYLQDITYGFTNPMPDAEEGPWKITAKDVVNGIVNLDTARKTLQESYDKLTEKSKPQLGDVLLTKDGTLGRTAVVEIGGMCVNQSVAVLRINEKILPKYLSILLQMPKYQRDMIADAGGGTIKHIYITKVVKMPIVVPSIEEQNTFLDFVNQVDKSKVVKQKVRIKNN